MTDTDLGTLTRHGDDWQVRFTRRLPQPLEKVWRAVTEPEHLKVWFPDEIVGERRAGAPLKFVNDRMDSFEGEMLAFDPPTLMELQWGPTNRLRIELEADGEGTVLTLTETLGQLGEAARDGAGWHECLARLDAELAGTEPVDWGEGWKQVHPRYVERFGPDASTIGPPEGWDES
jgi:uncharacterized protein YndB with AHSA1/START domain